MQSAIYDQQKNIADLLQVDRGITALVGGGGKTTLLYALAAALSLRGRVIVTTSTHILLPLDMPYLCEPTDEQLSHVFTESSVICVGKTDENGKIVSIDRPIKDLLRFCDYLLVEADGAKHLPLKAPAPHEPVLPEGTNHVIAVAGLEGVGHRICEKAFRPDLYASILKKSSDAVITAQDVAAVLQHPSGQRKQVAACMRFSVVLNQADTPDLQGLGRTVASYLDPKLVSSVLIAALRS